METTITCPYCHGEKYFMTEWGEYDQHGTYEECEGCKGTGVIDPDTITNCTNNCIHYTPGSEKTYSNGTPYDGYCDHHGYDIGDAEADEYCEGFEKDV
jgi:hypothetical protein